VSLDDWILALHVLSATAFVAGIVLFWVLIAAVRRTDTPQATIRMGPLETVAEAAIGIGSLGTLVLGIWLALSIGGYDLWDGWVIAAIVLWAIATGLGQRANVAYAHGVKKAEELQAAGQTGPSAELLTLNRTSNGFLMHTLVSVVVLLILIDMISKPGA
jgi:uncharacterized membrane protein